MGYNPWGHKESDTTERLLFLSLCLTVLANIFNNENEQNGVGYIYVYI